MINKNLTYTIYSYNFINERNVIIRLWIDKIYVSVVGTYAPEEGWAKDTQEFYETLQGILKNTNKNDFLCVAGNMNARVGNKPINFVLGTNGENIIRMEGN
jgi:hypothetical protein